MGFFQAVSYRSSRAASGDLIACTATLASIPVSENQKSLAKWQSLTPFLHQCEEIMSMVGLIFML